METDECSRNIITDYAWRSKNTNRYDSGVETLENLCLNNCLMIFFCSLFVRIMFKIT
jgi:hypothetical protein